VAAAKKIKPSGKRLRRIRTRYEKLASIFGAFLRFALALDWLTFAV
jgi:hypothetical protein